MSEVPRDPRLTSLLEKPATRPETPDIESQQGRRNAFVQLLDSEGTITPKVRTACSQNAETDAP